jgi:hypothetical protein
MIIVNVPIPFALAFFIYTLFQSSRRFPILSTTTNRIHPARNDVGAAVGDAVSFTAAPDA